MTSEQRAELVRGHANRGQDAAQGALGNVSTRVDVYRDCTTVGMVHHMSAAVDPRDRESDAFKRPDYLRSRYGRDAARHKPVNYQKSGDVERHREFLWWPDLFEQKFKCSAQVRDRGFLRRPVAERGNARAKLRGAAPDAVLVLLNDVGHVNDSCHELSIA
jgi:hypothetical protein